MSKVKTDSQPVPLSMSSKKVCVAWAVETPRRPPNASVVFGERRGYSFL